MVENEARLPMAFLVDEVVVADRELLSYSHDPSRVGQALRECQHLQVAEVL